MIRHEMDNVQTYEMIQENIALLEQKLQRKIDEITVWLRQDKEDIKKLNYHLDNLHARCDGLDVRIEAYEKNCTHRHKIIGKELSSCIDVKLLYSDRQAREAWQKGCEAMIESLHKRLTDLDFMFKQTVICVDNSHADENAKRFCLAPVSQLTTALSEELNKTRIGFDLGSSDSAVFSKIRKEGDRYILETVVNCVGSDSIKIHHPSRKHLEGKLREKNEIIKEHKDQIQRVEKMLGESISHHQNALQRIGHLSEALGCLQKESDELRKCNDQLIKGRDMLLEKVNHLRSIRSMGEKCDKPCCRSAPACYV